MTDSSQTSRGANSQPDDGAATPRSRPTPGWASAQRPPRTYETGPVTQLLRIATAVIAAVTAIACLVFYPRFPETIPIHFDFAGNPDAWGHRSSTLMIVGVFVVMIGGITWLSYHPRVFNYPVPVTEEHAQSLYRVGEQMIVWVNAACAVLFVGAVTSAVSQVGGMFMTLGIVGMIAALVAGVVKTLHVGGRAQQA